MFRKWNGELVYLVFTLLAVFALWELIVWAAKVPRYLLPRPSEVIVAMFVQSPELLRESLVTLKEIVIGFIVSVLVAVPLAVLIVSSRVFEKSVYPVCTKNVVRFDSVTNSASVGRDDCPDPPTAGSPGLVASIEVIP